MFGFDVLMLGEMLRMNKVPVDGCQVVRLSGIGHDFGPGCENRRNDARKKRKK
jgi:hypothetical protein